MATIDKLDLSVYNLYAVRTRMVEQLNEQLRLDEASSIPPQTTILNTQAQLSQLDVLMGIGPMTQPLPWALFLPPEKFGKLRRSPFTFSKIAPSIFSGDEEEEEEESFLEWIECKTEEEKEEKSKIKKCFRQLNEINDWLGFIVGRIGQFLQG